MPSAVSALRRLLAHPLTAGLDLDDPATTSVRRAVIESKPFLKRIYDDWYAAIVAELPDGDGGILELGSGAGFLCDRIPQLISSEVFHCGGVKAVLDAHALPFAASSLRAIVMTNVLHHVQDPREFFREASRCLRPEGRIIAIEPWVSSWSRVVYTRLHHEPFDPGARSWTVAGSGPLSDANGALPWILFERDKHCFQAEFPQLRTRRITPMMPFRYLASGGIFSRNVMPSALYPAWRALERAVQPWMPKLAMFALIVVERA